MTLIHTINISPSFYRVIPEKTPTLPPPPFHYLGSLYYPGGGPAARNSKMHHIRAFEGWLTSNFT